MSLSKKERGALVSAAIGYAGLNYDQAAKKLAMSVETLGRIRRGAAPLTAERKTQIVALTKVPAEFLEVGFAPFASKTEQASLEDVRGLATRLLTLEREIDVLRTDLQRHSSASASASHGRKVPGS